jgi:hypothetical protein
MNLKIIYLTIIIFLHSCSGDKSNPYIEKNEDIGNKEKKCSPPQNYNITEQLNVFPHVSNINNDELIIDNNLKIIDIITFFQKNVYKELLNTSRENDVRRYLDFSSYDFFKDSVNLKDVDYCHFGRIFYDSKLKLKYIEYYSMDDKYSNIIIYPLIYRKFSFLMAAFYNQEKTINYESRVNPSFTNYSFCFVDKVNKKILGFETDISDRHMLVSDSHEWPNLYYLDGCLFPKYSVHFQTNNKEIIANDGALLDKVCKFKYRDEGYILNNWCSISGFDSNTMILNNQSKYNEILSFFNKIETLDSNSSLIPHKEFYVDENYKNIASPPLWAY